MMIFFKNDMWRSGISFFIMFILKSLVIHVIWLTPIGVFIHNLFINFGLKS